MELLKDESWSY